MKKLQGVTLRRTVGMEFEGYSKMARQLERDGVPMSQVKHDASLRNSYYNVQYNKPVGLEIVTEPFMSLDTLDTVFDSITSYGWNTGRGTAGTHVHVGASDFSALDRVKAAIFLGKIEDVLFRLVKPYRFSRTSQGTRNRYCRSINQGSFIRLLEFASRMNVDPSRFIMFHEFHHTLQVNAYEKRIPMPAVETDRYHSVNIFATRSGTIEFRLFHAVRSSVEAKKFGLIAYHLVETIKNSALPQLDYIAEKILSAETAEESVKLLSEGIGLNFIPKLHNKDLQPVIIRRRKGVRRAVAI